MPTIVCNGIKLVFEDRSAGKPAFVFVHGTSCNRSFFAPQAEHFARRHRVVSVDLRGHGESDKPPGPYPIAAYADDIAYIIEQVGLSKVVAVGHSMGGVIVLQLARNSHRGRCIGALDLRKSSWQNGLSQGQGESRCRQNVARRYSNLHASKGALWWARLLAVRSPRMPVPFCWRQDRAVRLIDRFATAGRRSWSRNNPSAPKLTRRVTALSGRGDGTSPFSRLFNFQGKGAVGGATCVFPSHLSQRRRAGLPMLQIPA
jgi:pimeloyl-ACP methyl ester carboxylesterase